MTARNHSIVGTMQSLGRLWPICVLACALFTGCNESIRRYVKLGGWNRSPKNPMMISGSSESDSQAYAGSFDELDEADWKVLEQIAPRPIWERIAEMQKQFGRPIPATRPDEEATAPSKLAQNNPPPTRYVPTTDLGNGSVQMYYKLHHYGGSDIRASHDSGTERKKITVIPADLKPLETLITKHLGKNGNVVGLPSENALVVTCTKEVKDSVLALLNNIDQPKTQVEITARIFEVSHDFDFQYGAKALLKHISGDNKQGLATAFSAKDFIGSVIDPLEGTVTDPGGALRLMQIFSDAGITLDATFEALDKEGLVKVVASPRLTVASGQTASILAGQELPVQSAKISNDQFITQNLTYKPIGVQLHITPRTVGTDTVKMHVVTIVSAISGFSPLPTLESGFSPDEAIINPIIDTREAETYVTVGDGSTLVIGGMKMVRTVTRENKIPGLGDIEIIEWLFKNHRSQKQTNDLYFFLTPHIVPHSTS